MVANAACLKRQIFAMQEMLKNPDTEPFRKVFLNHEPTLTDITDVSAYTGLSEAEIKSRIGAVTNRSRKNTEQQHNMFTIIEGNPGCGKKVATPATTSPTASQPSRTIPPGGELGVNVDFLQARPISFNKECTPNMPKAVINARPQN